MEDSDKDKWKDAMNLERESMYSNSVWELVGPPEEVRLTGCKWIYKKKKKCRWENRDFQRKTSSKRLYPKRGSRL